MKQPVCVRNSTDYSPFGVSLDGRTIESDGYRYGFQNQERDDELKGKGNSLNFEFRMHDPRVGRFFAVDPLASKYPWNSPYAFSENKVIAFFELSGKEKKPTSTESEKYMIFIFSQEEIDFKMSNFQNEYKGYKVIVASDIEVAAKELISQIGTSGQISTLIICLHGLETNFPGEKAINSSPENNTGNPRDKNLSSYEIDNYIHGAKNENNESANDDVEALSSIVRSVESGGEIVFISCRVGGDGIFNSSISTIANEDVDIYTNTDRCTYYRNTDCTFSQKNQLLTDPNNFLSGEGWMKTTNCNTEWVMSLEPNNTGNISIDFENKNNSVVKFEKRN